MRKNWPRRGDPKKIVVDNSKSIIDQAFPNLVNLSTIAMATYFEMRMGISQASDEDVVPALSTPLSMLQDASESIKTVKEIGEKQKKQKTRELVMNIFTIVLSVLSFAGEAAQALGGAARIAMMALVIGEAGNVGLSIAEIIDNLMSAPFAVLGALAVQKESEPKVRGARGRMPQMLGVPWIKGLASTPSLRNFGGRTNRCRTSSVNALGKPAEKVGAGYSTWCHEGGYARVFDFVCISFMLFCLM